MQRLLLRGVILGLVLVVGLIGGAILVAQVLTPAATPVAFITPTNSEVTVAPVASGVVQTAVASPSPTLDPSLETPIAVLFPPGSDAAGHTFFPLKGQHATLECVACHPAGRYQGTARTCESCHLADKPEPHFTGTCAQCHTEAGWLPAVVDHSTLTDCLGCHTPDKPVNHFSGQCSLCHSTSAWLPAVVDHSTLTDCLSCHTPDRPANHFSGQCSLCHSTSAWLPATFDHSTIGQTDCAACHTPPANHYSGACRNCHTNTSDWRDVNFDHTGFTDCRACHTPPAGHYPWQCSACHAPGAWLPASFNHPFPMTHGDANGNCAACHVGETRAWTCTNCHNADEMNEEHADEDIFNITNRCIECHADGREGDDGVAPAPRLLGQVVARWLRFLRATRP